MEQILCQGRGNQKSMNRTLNLSVALMLVFLNQTKAQLTILKDSLQIGEMYYVLEEPKLSDQYSKVAMEFYKKVRSQAILSSYFTATPEQRLKAKKDSLKALIANDELRQAGYGFEHYEVFYDQGGLLNLSVSIQSYGSPFESRKAYCFDLATGKLLGKALFVSHNGLVKIIADKLKMQKKGLKVNLETLDQYEMLGHKGVFEGIKFLITDTVNYRNSGYEIFEVELNKKEIAPYLAPAVKKLLN